MSILLHYHIEKNQAAFSRYGPCFTERTPNGAVAFTEVLYKGEPALA